MGRIPALKPSEAMRILRNLGFELIRQKGSHCQFKHPNGRQTTVPDHRGRDQLLRLRRLPPATLYHDFAARLLVS